jgi:hypothetical protein
MSLSGLADDWTPRAAEEGEDGKSSKGTTVKLPPLSRTRKNRKRAAYQGGLGGGTYALMVYPSRGEFESCHGRLVGFFFPKYLWFGAYKLTTLKMALKEPEKQVRVEYGEATGV